MNATVVDAATVNRRMDHLEHCMNEYRRNAPENLERIVEQAEDAFAVVPGVEEKENDEHVIRGSNTAEIGDFRNLNTAGLVEARRNVFEGGNLLRRRRNYEQWVFTGRDFINRKEIKSMTEVDLRQVPSKSAWIFHSSIF